MENSLQFGAASAFVDIGTMMLNAYFHKPLAKSEILKLRTQRAAAVAGLPTRFSQTHIGPNNSFVMGELVRDPKRIAVVEAAYNKRIAGVKSRYRSLRGMTKLIGWSYLGLFAADMTEKLVTPSVTRAALQSNMEVYNPPMMDSNIAYTQRTRALQAIFDSQLGIRTVFGQEAVHWHK